MLIRRLRPLNGWRAFAGEVGVVVLGILIALGADAAVTQLRWRGDVAESRAAMDAEIGDQTTQLYERIAVEPCLRARIAQLAAKIDAGGDWRGDPADAKTGPDQPVVRPVYRTPYRAWTADAWTRGGADGTIARLPRALSSNYASVYAMLAEVRALQTAENETKGRIAFLSRDRTLDERTRIEVIRDLTELDRANLSIVSIGRQVIALARDIGIDPAAPQRVAELRETLKQQRASRGDCVRTDIDPRRD